MRRIIMALFAMVAGTTLLVGLKSQGLGLPFQLAAEGPVDPAGGDAGAAGGPGEPTGATGASATPGSSPAASASAGADPATGTPAQAPSASTAPAVDPPPGVSGTFSGMAVAVKTAQSPNNRSNPCGDCHNYSMSVTITLSGGQITNATVAYNADPGESLRYADKASNTLSPQILTAQTWLLGNVSGATYSANAFELSVRDAMTKAGLPT